MRIEVEMIQEEGEIFRATAVSYPDVSVTGRTEKEALGLLLEAVGKYLKTVTYQEVTSQSASAALGELCGRAARVEFFEGHARSGDVRAHKYAGAPLPWAPASL